MAKKNKSKNPKNKKIKKKKGPPIRLYLFILAVCAAVFVPTTLLFFVCLLPSVIASMVDQHPQKTLGITVGAMNFAGTLPPWLQLLETGHTLGISVDLITNPSVIMIAYGAAAIGYLIYWYVTPFISTIMVGRTEHRVKEITKEQDRLVDKWGESVTRI